MSATQDAAYLSFVEGRLQGLRVNRYSWWQHWRELASNFLPRRYKWVITPNQQSRGNPINQAIIDNTGTFAARNLAAGLLSGKSSPTRPWLKLKVNRIDSTGTNPVSLWLAECERLMYLVFAESNFYNSIAQFYYDLVIFGTAVMMVYEDYEDVINCYNPCAGEYYLDVDGTYRPCILYREFTMTIGAVVDKFGIDNVSIDVRQSYEQPGGVGRTREIIVAQAIEPNTDDKDFGIPKSFEYREVYWEYGGSAPTQSSPRKFLRKRGYHEKPFIAVRWDIVSNDAYGRSPAMDGLGDQKQLQQETRRKAQAIDKGVNPPLVADMQLKNQPASSLPGGITYIQGFAQSGKPGIASIYNTNFSVKDVSEDLVEVRERLKRVFFNDLFMTISQYITRSNVTATEIDARRAESMIMIGPVLERIDHEGLKVAVERTFARMVRGGIFPPPPEEIAGQHINIEFVSMLATAQAAAAAGGIERLLGLTGNLAAVDPTAMDKINVDYTLDKYSALLNNDPKLMRSDGEVIEIRQQRQEQQQQMMQAQMASEMAAGAKTLSETNTTGDNALTQMLGAAQ